MPVNGSTVALGAKANITQQIAFAFGTIAGTQLCIRADINYSTPFLNTTNGRASFLTSTACYSYIAPLDSTQTQLFGPVPFPAVIAGCGWRGGVDDCGGGLGCEAAPREAAP